MMAEFLDRLKLVDELNGEQNGNVSPLDRHVKLMHKRMQKWANRAN